jgi:hypothetical protein
MQSYRVAKLAKYFNSAVALCAFNSTAERVVLRMMTINLYYSALDIFRNPRLNLLTLCLIYRKHTESIRHEIITSKTATLWTLFQNTAPTVSSSEPYNTHDGTSELSIPSLISVFSEIGHWHNRGFMQTELTFGGLEFTNSESFRNIGWKEGWAYSLGDDSLPP